VATLFLFVGLLVFIWSCFRGSLRGLIAIMPQFLRGLSKLVFSAAKVSFSLDVMFMLVRAGAVPPNRHHYRLALMLPAVGALDGRGRWAD
jgi:hypothetical protein